MMRCKIFKAICYTLIKKFVCPLLKIDENITRPKLTDDNLKDRLDKFSDQLQNEYYYMIPLSSSFVI